LTSEDDLNKRRAEIDKRARKLNRRNTIVTAIVLIAILVAIGVIFLMAQRGTQELVDVGCEIHSFNQFGMAASYSCPGDPGYSGP
jgi:uncharacterized membrane protein